MVISKGLEKGLITSFSGYLTVKGEKAEDLFLIFSAKELKDFYQSSDPISKDIPSSKSCINFLMENNKVCLYSLFGRKKTKKS